jgi:3-deoxy-D-manno-octulosonate 8-phosphate phosphatase (KDO 8-P phosphatase)
MKVHNVLDYFKQISTFVFDVDGVLTDGSLVILPNGVMARNMNTKDGFALQLAIKKGYNIIIISGGSSPEVEYRLSTLGITEVYMKAENKLSILQNHLSKKNISATNVLFMGDDIPDIEAMKSVHLATCPSDATQDVLAVAEYVSPYPGGKGCVRDVIEKVMKLQGTWTTDTNTQSL